MASAAERFPSAPPLISGPSREFTSKSKNKPQLIPVPSREFSLNEAASARQKTTLIAGPSIALGANDPRLLPSSSSSLSIISEPSPTAPPPSRRRLSGAQNNNANDDPTVPTTLRGLISEPSQKLAHADRMVAPPTTLISGPSRKISPSSMNRTQTRRSGGNGNGHVVIPGTGPTRLIPGPSLGGDDLARGRNAGITRPSPHTSTTPISNMRNNNNGNYSPTSFGSGHSSSNSNSNNSSRRETSIPWHALSHATSDTIIDSAPEPTDLIPAPSQAIQAKSMRNEVVAVFNANTADGSRIVRALSKSGAKVVAIVRVFTSRNTENLMTIPNVKIRVGGQLDEEAAVKALDGVDRVFLCLKYWERFTNDIERQQAEYIVKACIAKQVPNLVFSTFEDTKLLRASGYKSQIVPDTMGRIEPPMFTTMQTVKKLAKSKNVRLTHMITSYLDEEQSKKSLCLIVGENGKLLVQPHLMEE